MAKERIAIFARFLEDGGGLERVILNLIKGLVDRDYIVDLLLFSAEGPFMQFIPEDVHVIDFGSPRILSTIPRLARYLRQEKPMVLYCAETDRGFAGVIAKFLAVSSTPIVIGIHIIESKHRQAKLDRKAKLLISVKRIISPFAKKFIPVSQGVADDIIKDLHISKEKIQVIYNPVVSEKLKQDMQKTADHHWLQEKTIPVVLAAGRLVDQKDFITLLHAFKDVISQYRAHLIIIGEGPQRPKLDSLIQELDLADYVDMPGFVNNPYAYMKNADLFVLSSKFEGFGNVLVEAMACGCPVVSTDCVAGPSEILQDGEYGPLVPVGNSEALGEAILNALQHDHDISKLQERAEDFSEDKIVDEYLELFHLL